jgi:hypothetical protein
MPPEERVDLLIHDILTSVWNTDLTADQPSELMPIADPSPNGRMQEWARLSHENPAVGLKLHYRKHDRETFRGLLQFIGVRND